MFWMTQQTGSMESIFISSINNIQYLKKTTVFDKMTSVKRLPCLQSNSYTLHLFVDHQTNRIQNLKSVSHLFIRPRCFLNLKVMRQSLIFQLLISNYCYVPQTSRRTNQIYRLWTRQINNRNQHSICTLILRCSQKPSTPANQNILFGQFIQI